MVYVLLTCVITLLESGFFGALILSFIVFVINMYRSSIRVNLSCYRLLVLYLCFIYVLAKKCLGLLHCIRTCYLVENAFLVGYLSLILVSVLLLMSCIVASLTFSSLYTFLVPCII